MSGVPDLPGPDPTYLRIRAVRCLRPVMSSYPVTRPVIAGNTPYLPQLIGQPLCPETSVGGASDGRIEPTDRMARIHGDLRKSRRRRARARNFIVTGQSVPTPACELPAGK